MATRADFYVLDKDNKLDFLGSTVNEYDGPFSDAKTEKEYRHEVGKMLKLNESVEGQWYWPWENSKISDEVFVFKCSPTFFNKGRGSVLSKVHCKELEMEENKLALLPYDTRYDFDDEDGYVALSIAEKHLILELPNMK